MRYALVLHGASETDDSVLLSDWTWITFPRQSAGPTGRRPLVWLFGSVAEAARVRVSFQDSVRFIRIVPVD